MAKISALKAREILDSKGDPVVEVELKLEDGSVGIDAVPSGASTGNAEALELRDNDPSHYSGRGVLKAVSNVNNEISQAILGKEYSSQSDFDTFLISLDNTTNKSHLGANAVLPVSLAFARASAASVGQPLYRNIWVDLSPLIPRPMILMIEGGKHGDWATDIQEFMILSRSDAFASFTDTLEAGLKIFRNLGSLLEEKKYSTGVGFEGAYCPRELKSNEEALDLICRAVEKSGFSMPDKFVIAADMAASEFFQDGRYVLKSEAGQVYETEAWEEKIIYWTKKYPLYSIEDPFDQEEWGSWTSLMSKLGNTHQIVGDDLVVTNVSRITRAIEEKACNAAIIKPNQIGTVTETVAAIDLCHKNNIRTIVSHRAGETCDPFIADLSVASSGGQCKFGGPNRGERMAKYNRLLNIEEDLLSK